MIIEWKDIVILCLVIILLLIIFFSMRKKRRSKDVRDYVKAIRKELRNHHFHEKELFKNIDNAFSQLIYRENQTKQTKRSVGGWEEYG